MNEDRIIVALLNATWQSVALVFLVACGLRALQRTSASVRCAIWSGVLLIVVALPALDYAAVRSIHVTEKIHAADVSQPAAGAPVRLPIQVADVSRRPAVAIPQAVALSPSSLRLGFATLLHQGSQAAVVLWIAGIVLLGLRFGFQMTCLVRAKEAIEPVDRLALSRWMPVGRAVRLGVSDRVAVPCLLGLFRPVIALPRVLAAELPDEDLQRIVLHESAHLARFDDWFNLLEQLALVVLFFNPALHYVARRISMEREIACDDHVIASCVNRVTYAECLTELARRCTARRALTVPGFFTNRRQIRVRIEQLLDRGHNGSPRVGRVAFASIGCLCALGILLSQVGIPVIAASVTCRQSRAAVHTHAVQRHTGLRVAIATPFDKLRVTPDKLRVTPDELRVTPDKLRVTPDKLRVTPVAKLGVTLTPHRGHCECHALMHSHSHLMSRAEYRVKEVFVKRMVSSTAASSPAHGVSVATTGTDASQSYEVASLARQEQDSSSSGDLAQAGYAGLSVDELIDLHDHGVTPEYIALLRGVGYVHLQPAQLIDMRDHGVTASFAHDMNALAGRLLPVDALIDLRDHGVSAEFAATLAAHGLHPSYEELIELADHGVSPAYLASLAAAGYGDLSVQEAIDLRDHGVTGAYIEHIRRDLHPAKLSVNELIRLRDSGI